ncbi:MAG: GMC family oxidoreductase N-terminal domain-containing protein [Oligoflexales bacterium]
MSTEQVSICIAGAGYGGNIMAARLAEALKTAGLTDHKIVLLERGYDYHGVDPLSTLPYRNEFGMGFKQLEDPRYLGQIFNHYADINPAHLINGGPTMHVQGGKGVGGGSLINGAASVRAPKETFEQTNDAGKRIWPGLYNRNYLNPYYTRVEKFLNVVQLQWTSGNGPDWALATKRDHTFAIGCLKAGFTAQPIPVALEKCRNCGWCYSGCPFDAKTAANYFKYARSLGVRIDSQCNVESVSPADDQGGYLVNYHDGRDNTDKTIECQILIISGGPIGTPGMLMKSAGNFAGARGFSGQLGKNLSANGDHFLGGIVGEEYEVKQYQGKVVNSSTFSFWKDYKFIIECFSLQPWMNIIGLPAQMSAPDHPEKTGRKSIDPAAQLWGKDFKSLLDQWGRRLMCLLVLGIDQAEGEIKLRPTPAGLRPSAEWPKTHPKTEAMWAMAVKQARKVFQALDGDLLADSYRDEGIVTAPHAVGGCRMGETKAMGVVDPNGEVFGNRNLFVSDGSVLPPIGVNPYMTIAAVAERNSEILGKQLSERLQ